MMEQFAKFGCYCRRTTRSDNNASTSPPSSASSPHVKPDSSSSAASAQNLPTGVTQQQRIYEAETWEFPIFYIPLIGNLLRQYCILVERIMNWDKLYKSVQYFMTISIYLMISYTLYFKGSSMNNHIIFLVIFWYVSNMLVLIRVEIDIEVVKSKFRKYKQMVKNMLHSIVQLREKQPGLFCMAVCSVSVTTWLLNYMLNGLLLMYIVFLLILMLPIPMIYLPVTRLPGRPPMKIRRDSDSEIEEFLPAATETNMQILTKAGDAGEYSPTPTSTLAEVPKEHEEQEFLNDGDLAGHKMPSHEDGSSDGLELSDLELSEKSSTSSCSSQSDSEFEIIDRQEIGKLCTSQNST